MARTTTRRKTTKPRKQNTRSRRFRQLERRKFLLVLMFLILVILSVIIFRACFRTIDISKLHYPSYVQQNMISEDGHSRTGKEMKRVNDIVIHYVANPGSTAKANRNFFDSPNSNVSAHFVVGLKGEVIQCVPLDEQSSASNDRNPDTISIEVCHPDSSGKFNDKTYNAVVKLTAWLCDEFGLNQKDVIRHYDITGKACPKYYVDQPDSWEEFRKDVKRAR